MVLAYNGTRKGSRRQEPSRGGAAIMSLNETAPGDRVIRCDYQRPRKGSVPTLGWQVGWDMGNSKTHLQYVMEYRWVQAKAVAQAAVVAAQTGGAPRGCPCADVSPQCLHLIGVFVAHVYLRAGSPDRAH